MDIKSLFKQGEELIQKGYLNEATFLYTKIVNESKNKKKILWAKKHIADIVGYCGYKNYDRAIELYKEIIEDAASYPDLVKWCEIDIGRSRNIQKSPK